MNSKAVDSDEFDQYFSFFDLEQHPDWQEAWKSQDRERVTKILYSLGCDTNYGWEITVCSHRTRTTNQIEYGPRLGFKQRTDKNWIKNLTVEDQIAATSDVFLRADLLSINRQSNFTGQAMDKYGSSDVEVGEEM